MDKTNLSLTDESKKSLCKLMIGDNHNHTLCVDDLSSFVNDGYRADNDQKSGKICSTAAPF